MLIHQEGYVSSGGDGCGEGCIGNEQFRISSSRPKACYPQTVFKGNQWKDPTSQVFHLQSPKELVTTFYIHLPDSIFPLSRERTERQRLKSSLGEVTLLKKISNTNEALRIAHSQDAHLQTAMTNQELNNV